MKRMGTTIVFTPKGVPFTVGISNNFGEPSSLILGVIVITKKGYLCSMDVCDLYHEPKCMICSVRKNAKNI